MQKYKRSSIICKGDFNIIFVLKDTENYNDTYYIEKYKTKEEAIESIQEVSGYIKDFIFIEGNELELNFKMKGAKDE